MNYRHAFHAGNFADVLKHALLMSLLKSFHQKDSGFVVLDTHSGPGTYDLSSDAATRTGEWRDGVGRLFHDNGTIIENLPPSLELYVQGVRARGAPKAYPGSPCLIADMLRPQDALICSELHPEDAATLRRVFRRNPQVSVHHLDGYQMIKAVLPPKTQRRGLVLIDPPFEKTDEFTRLSRAITMARQRFSTGVVAAWYPIKHRSPVRAFHDQLMEGRHRHLLACEFSLRPAIDPARLNGCGLLIANPPWQFDEEAKKISESLAPLLAADGIAEGSVRWIVEE